METFTCTQHGCEFEADELPELCPVCQNPQVEAADISETEAEVPWTDYTFAELREQAADWGLTGFSKLNKTELIAELEQAEADDQDD